ncbi:DUF4232 domain-containing protein [Saccharopolyspora shandongensis]|uniref:DUF4232 domain-containing protein n=1 Tax=Saccharopolyspora shandongensis TaxID=418495 RepID=UPI003410946E
MINRTRTLGAVAGLFTGALLLAGCGQAAPSAPSDGGSANAQTQTGSQTSSQTPDPVLGHGGQGSITPPDSSCSAKDFKVELNVQPDRPGILLLAVTNNSKRTCHLNGYPTVVPTDMSGQAHNDLKAKQVEIPGKPVAVDLTPGTTGFAGLQIIQGDKADSNAITATGFNVSVPGVSGAINADIVGTTDGGVAEYTIKSMNVGSLQPSSQGVTVFG